MREFRFRCWWVERRFPENSRRRKSRQVTEMRCATRETVLRANGEATSGVSVTTTVTVKELPAVTRSPKVRADLPIEPVGYLDRKVRLVPDLREVWSYINPFMLFGRHLGYRGNFAQQL